MQIHSKETMGTLFNRLNFLGFELLLKVLILNEKATLPRSVQPKGDFILGSDFSDDELFIDYNKPAAEIERFIRALNPFFIASTFFRNTMVKIYSAQVVESKTKSDFQPGTVVKIEDDKFYIATKDGLLMPTVLQFGSFFGAPAKDFIDVVNLKIGEKFG